MEEENMRQTEYLLQPISWRALEYEHSIRSSDWYWSLWIISISLAIAAVIFKNIFLGILILLGAFTFTLFAKRNPRLVTFRVDQKGIYSGDIVYPYSLLDSFWIESMAENQSRLIIKSKKKLVPYIVIPVEDIGIDELRYFLIHFLPEEEHEEPLLVRVMEWMGF